MRKILITAISGNVSNGILKILQGTENEVYGCDINDYPVGMDKVKYFWKSDIAVKPEYVPNIILKCKEAGITHLIPVNEEEIRAISSNIDKLYNAGIKVVINTSFIINTFLDKFKTYEYLKDLGNVCVPRTYEYDTFEEDGKKYIVKLRCSCGSKFVKIITRKMELESLSLERDKYIIQEYIESSENEYTVGIFSDGNKILSIIFRRKLSHGYTSFVELVKDESIEKSVTAIAKSVNLRGFINIQLRKYQGRNYVFEINPRISGTVVFRHMLGFEDVLWWLDMLDNRKIPEYECKYKTAVGLRELKEKFVILH